MNKSTEENSEFLRRYTYYDGNKDKEHIVSEFKKPLKQKYEMDKYFEKIIKLPVVNEIYSLSLFDNYFQKIS